jgi:hypothetical protein
MKLKPVVQVELPAYPTQDELRADEQVLDDSLPERWRKAKGLTKALTLFLAANLSGGCGSEAGNQGVQTSNPPQTKFTWPKPTNPSPSLDFTQASEWVSSIFADKNKMPVMLAGDVSIVTPRINEDGIQGLLQDNQK